MFGGNFLKWTKWACHINEINWQHLLPVVEFELFNENFKFLENFAATPVSLTASQYSKTYLMRLAVKLMNGFGFFLMGSGTWVDFPRLLSWALISLLHNPGCKIRWLWGIVTTQSLSHPSLSAFLLLLCGPSLQAPLLGSGRHTPERHMPWSQLWYYHRRDPGTGHISPVIAALKPVSPECGPWPLCK